jgi:hypothetical protein
MTEFEHATVAAHLAAALVTAHAHLAAAGIPLKQPQNQNAPRNESGLTPQGAVALYRSVLAELSQRAA